MLFSEKFKAWYPDLGERYHQSILDLAADHIFTGVPHSVFCQHSVNLGPQTCCEWHNDSQNLPPGICGIGVFGDFNHRISGHALLREARVIMEVAHGDTYYLPSSIITHRNAHLRKGETHYSIVSYLPGGVFWHYHKKGRTEEKGVKEGTLEGHERWMHGVSLFPIIP